VAATAAVEPAMSPTLSSQFTGWDWLVVIGYLAFTTWLGAKMAGRQASIRDFFLGGRKLPWYAVSGSIIATEISAVTFVSVPFVVFKPEGNFTYLQLGLIGTFLARIIVGYVLVPAYYKREIYSPYDYMHNQLGGQTRTMTTILFSLGGMLAQSARVYLTAEVLIVVLHDQLVWLAEHTGIPELAWAIIFIGLVSVGWTLIGGITTVIWTDVILFLVFLLGAVVALVVIALQLGGGFGEILRTGWAAESSGAWGKFTFFDFDTSPTRAYTIWTAAIASTWGGIGQYGTDQLLAQRMFCCKNSRDARWAIISSTLSQCVTLTVMLVGVGLFTYYTQFAEPAAPADTPAAVSTVPEVEDGRTEFRLASSVAEQPEAAPRRPTPTGHVPDNPDLSPAEHYPRLKGDALAMYEKKGDRIFPIFIVEVIPIGLKGLIIAGVFAAAISSLMGILTALSQVIMTAFYNPLRERTLRARGIEVSLSGNVEELAESAEPTAEDRRTVFVSRLMVIFWGVVLCMMAYLASVVSEYYPSILDLALAMAGYAGGALLAGFALSFLPLRIDSRGFMYSGPLSVFYVFALVWHDPWTHVVCWAAAIVFMITWIWPRMNEIFSICEIADPQERNKRALAVVLRDWPQTLLLIVGLWGMLWLNYYGFFQSVDADGNVVIEKVAWPWYYPLGSSVAFIWGFLLARRREPKAN
jgi:Na+/proline symporter